MSQSALSNQDTPQMALESVWDAAKRASGHEDMDRVRWNLPRSMPGSRDADAHIFSGLDCMLMVLRHLYSLHPDHACLKGQDSENITGVAAETLRLAMSSFMVTSEEDNKRLDAARRLYISQRAAQFPDFNTGMLTFENLMLFLEDLWETSPDFDLYKAIGRKRRGVDKYWKMVSAQERQGLLQNIYSPIWWDLSRHISFSSALHCKFAEMDMADDGYVYQTHMGTPRFLVVELDPMDEKPPGFDFNTVGRLLVPTMQTTRTPVNAPGGGVLYRVSSHGGDGTTMDEFCLLAVVRKRVSPDGLDFVRLYDVHGDNLPVYGDRDRFKHFMNDSWSLTELDSRYTLFYGRVGPAAGSSGHEREMTEVHTTREISSFMQRDMEVIATLFTNEGQAAHGTFQANMAHRPSPSLDTQSEVSRLSHQSNAPPTRRTLQVPVMSSQERDLQERD
ncbi:hypothetical protein N0V93_005871 [Gnomoniopsis smithogilvyi]|uniref:Uncharacterized protein n=1 Tax=Gnomoniopsis smithogilvyi TaxID=1191159 RepID=A0A9W8YTL3_9PEZI|nr:hypothetical protein N0V93_005871 [Gnomoniopsis smithogilvyi]